MKWKHVTHLQSPTDAKPDIYDLIFSYQAGPAVHKV